ncbi:MAG: DNA polymerase IV [Candidatus Diapherotrites archaeon]|nr:DNA polymerase IV [Candidatus Diapherotrites archaeon]
MQGIIGLLDLDYFYAQCEILRKPEIKSKPVVIVMPSLRENSGAIATCNYEARALKIRSGMPLSLAKKLASFETVFINADKPYYEDISQKVFEIVDFFCDKVEQVSIDEAYFDLSNPSGFSSARAVCVKIKQRIRAELGLTCSIGVSYNKLLAKMIASIKKPDGLFVVTQEESELFLSKQKVTALFGVGPKSEEIFKKYGVQLVSDIKKFKREDLVSWFGEANGSKLFDFAFGKDERVVDPNREKQQLSRMITIKQDSRDFEFVRQSIDFLSEMLYNNILGLKKHFKTVSLIIVTEKIETLTKSRTLSQPIESLMDLKQIEYALLKDFLNESHSLVRRVGVRVSNFDEDTGFQQKLFDF